MSETSPTLRAGAARASVRVRVAAALAGVVAAIPLCADAVPVVPMLQGYGVETPAGRGGQVFRVTNLNTSGAGSLQACVDASGPRVCVFEVSGTIRATRDLIIRNPYITIAGQTAPSPGIMYRGGALWVQASHVLVQHMRFRAGDDAEGPTPSNRDALKIDAPNASIANIVIDHCSFSWGVDEVASLWGGRFRFDTPLLFVLGLVSFVGTGGLGGLFLGNAVSDMYLHATYFVVGHFHFMIGWVTLFGVFAGTYYWFPVRKAPGSRRNHVEVVTVAAPT